jgi:hypothetical protein
VKLAPHCFKAASELKTCAGAGDGQEAGAPAQCAQGPYVLISSSVQCSGSRRMCETIRKRSIDTCSSYFQVQDEAVFGT